LKGPSSDCHLCPRLVTYRSDNRLAHPDWHNAPVASFGPSDARLLVVGMAPGVKGANRTGRPFTGDHAGLLLYQSLLKFGLADGAYAADPDDGLRLIGCRVTNAVRCVPPANLPKPNEIAACNPFLTNEIRSMPYLKVIFALGTLAHDAVLRACGMRRSSFKFQHGKLHQLPDGLHLANSYHVSRYNTSTRRLTTEMFEAVMFAIAQRLAR